MADKVETPRSHANKNNQATDDNTLHLQSNLACYAMKNGNGTHTRTSFVSGIKRFDYNL